MKGNQTGGRMGTTTLCTVTNRYPNPEDIKRIRVQKLKEAIEKRNQQLKK